MTGKICLVIAVSAALSMSAACGKKGPPVPPPVEFSAALTKLNADVDPGRVLLEGIVYGLESDLRSVTGCTVYHAWYPPGAPPCEGCPLDYREMETFRGQVVRNDVFSCRVPWHGEPGFHFFRVRLMGPGDRHGPPSPGVRVDRP